MPVKPKSFTEKSSKTMANRILVTGGAGFIGSNLVDELIKKGHQVFVIDNLSTGKYQNLNPKSKFIKLDITGDKIGEIVSKIKPAYIFHLAAQTSISKSVASPKEDFRTNLTALVPILEAAVKSKVKKFIFPSSAAVYGDSKKLPIVEDSPKNPVSPYGISKLCAEFLISSYQKLYGLPYAIFRFANVYGPRQDSSQEGGVVSIFIKNVLSNHPITIFGDGNQTRDFVYVSDVVRANMMVLEKNTIGIFNVSSGKETSINILSEKIAKSLKKKIKEVHEPARNLEIEESSLLWNKIKREINWSPVVDIDRGLKSTIDFLNENSTSY